LRLSSKYHLAKLQVLLQLILKNFFLNEKN